MVAAVGLKNVNVPRHADDRKTSDALQRTHEAIGQLGVMAGEYSIDIPINDGESTSEIRPPSFSTQQDNYNPAGWASARYVLLEPTAACNISGFESSGIITRRKTIIHNGSEVAGRPNGIPLGFLEESLSSSAANRIATPHPNDLFMLANWARELWYDRTMQRWRFI